MIWVISKARILIVDARAAEGRYDRLPGLAKEIVDFLPNAIVAEGTPAVAAAQRSTKTIPIVMAPASDPIGSGFVESFARPARSGPKFLSWLR